VNGEPVEGRRAREALGFDAARRPNFYFYREEQRHPEPDFVYPEIIQVR
jgi:hypothetical protein